MNKVNFAVNVRENALHIFRFWRYAPFMYDQLACIFRRWIMCKFPNVCKG